MCAIRREVNRTTFIEKCSKLDSQNQQFTVSQATHSGVFPPNHNRTHKHTNWKETRTRGCLPSMLDWKYGFCFVQVARSCVCAAFFVLNFLCLVAFLVLGLWTEQLSLAADHIRHTTFNRHIFYFIYGKRPLYRRTTHTHTHTHISRSFVIDWTLKLTHLLFVGVLLHGISCSSRYGREDEEVMGLKFCNEAVIALRQIWPPTEDEQTITPLQVRQEPTKPIYFFVWRPWRPGNFLRRNKKCTSRDRDKASWSTWRQQYSWKERSWEYAPFIQRTSRYQWFHRYQLSYDNGPVQTINKICFCGYHATQQYACEIVYIITNAFYLELKLISTSFHVPPSAVLPKVN